MLNENPFKGNTKIEAKEYLCILHNKVNKRLQKEQFDCKNLDSVWGTDNDDCGCDEEKKKEDENSIKNSVSKIN